MSSSKQDVTQCIKTIDLKISHLQKTKEELKEEALRIAAQNIFHALHDRFEYESYGENRTFVGWLEEKQRERPHDSILRISPRIFVLQLKVSEAVQSNDFARLLSEALNTQFHSSGCDIQVTDLRVRLPM